MRVNLLTGGAKVKTRREFLAATGIGLLGATVSAEGITSPAESGVGAAIAPQDPRQIPAQEPAGKPPAFCTATPEGPEASAGILVEAEKLVRGHAKGTDLSQAA